MKDAPWLLGIIEALKCVSLIRSSTLSTRNRLSLIMLDSTLEISLRQYLQNIKKITLDPKEHRPRFKLFDIAKKNINVPVEVWDHLDYYWNTRNPQYHQDANISVPDTVYNEFAELICFMLDRMFNIKSKEYLEFQTEQLVSHGKPDSIRIDTKKISSKIDAIIAVVTTFEISKAENVREGLRKFGISYKFSDEEIRAYLSQKYFYRDENGIRRLSHAGKEKLNQLIRE
jgi:hypothetical protein